MASAIIHPSEIHKELTRIWDSLEGTGKMRASLFNLIFFTKKRGRVDYMRAVAKKVIEKFPSRVIFITTNGSDSEGYLNARVSVDSCSTIGSDIACESIEIDVGGDYISRVPFVVLPHVLPDLPIYVVWGENPTDASPLFDQLQKFATRVIFDSDCVDNLTQFATKLLDMQENSHLNIADLNWARTESWRQLLSSTFYTEKRLKLLEKAEKIHILYNNIESEFYGHNSFQSLYLQGWLAAQLGWSLEEKRSVENGISLHYKRPEGKVTVFLVPERHDNMKAGSIISLDIETEGENHFSFGCDLDIPHLVSMRFSTPEKCEIPLKYVLDKEESGASLVKEICHRAASQHYLNLLKQMSTHKEYATCEY